MSSANIPSGMNNNSGGGYVSSNSGRDAHQNASVQMKALLWKNWILKVRGGGETVAELILPIFLAAIMALVLSSTPRELEEIAEVSSQPFFPLPDLITGCLDTEAAFIEGCTDYAFTIGGTDGNATLPFTSEVLTSIANFSGSLLPLAFESEKAMEIAVQELDEVPFVWSGIVWDQEPSLNTTTTAVLRTSSDALGRSIVTAGGSEVMAGSVLTSTMIGVMNAALWEDGQEPWNVVIGIQGMPTAESVSIFDPVEINTSVYAVIVFMAAAQSVLVSIVKERQLKIKEGMRIMGLTDSMFWGSWFVTGIVTFNVSALLYLIVCFIGGVYSYSSFTLMLFVFMVFSLSLLFFILTLSNLFDDHQTAGGVAALLILLTLGGWGYAAFAPFSVTAENEPPFIADFLSLLPSVPLGLAMRQAGVAEALQVGVDWSNMGTEFNTTPYSISKALLWLAIDIPVYLAIFLFTVVVYPRIQAGAAPLLSSSVAPVKPAEADTLGISIRGLSRGWNQKQAKEKGTKWVLAVDSLDLDIPKGQIFALLGHNGAGKSTVINMLSGLVKPTSGDAWVHGKSIVNELVDVRSSLGLCPQHDILWKTLTPKEHLLFYGRLKGLSWEEADAQALHWLKEMDIEEQQNRHSDGLSGGMKRKLSIGIAFMGDSQVVFLDECTAGMDPYSRHKVWELLQRLKTGRTIIMTTHAMEEADILGDSICILTKGKISAAGTSLHLKSHFGLGYTLVLTKAESGSTWDAAGTEALVKGVVPSAKFSWLEGEDSQAMGVVTASGVNEETVLIPQDSVDSLPDVLRALGPATASLGIAGYSVVSGSLESVFLKIASEAEAEINAAP